MTTILVVDDDRKITDMLRRTLIYEGYRVATAADGEEALIKAQSERPDLVVLDWLMPKLNGLETAKLLRETSPVPILMLTARDAVERRVEGLDSGADDYLVKPFAPEELLARIRALLRRRQPAEEQVLHFADLTMDTGTRKVTRGERDIELTAKEFDLLELFLMNPRQVLTRDTLYDRIWGYDFGGESNILEVYVRYLRAKLEAGGESRLLQTVRGVGYALREE